MSYDPRISPFYATSSGEKSADAVIRSSPGALCGVLINTDGTENITVKIYDHATAASGTVIYEQTVKGADITGGGLFSTPVNCDKGIYLDVTSSGTIKVLVFHVGRG